MTTQLFVYMFIEAIVFLLPLAKLWTSVGSWKKEVEMKIAQNQKDIAEVKNDTKENKVMLQKIGEQLVEINTKLNLIVDGKLKEKESGK